MHSIVNILYHLIHAIQSHCILMNDAGIIFLYFCWSSLPLLLFELFYFSLLYLCVSSFLFTSFLSRLSLTASFHNKQYCSGYAFESEPFVCVCAYVFSLQFFVFKVNIFIDEIFSKYLRKLSSEAQTSLMFFYCCGDFFFSRFS